MIIIITIRFFATNCLFLHAHAVSFPCLGDGPCIEHPTAVLATSRVVLQPLTSGRRRLDLPVFAGFRDAIRRQFA